MGEPVGERKGSKKWLWGCTGGCATLILVVALVIFLAFRYLRAPVPVPPAEVFITAETSAFLAVRIDPEQPLMREIPVALAQVPGIRSKIPTRQGRQFTMTADTARGTLQQVGLVQIVMVARPADGDPAFSSGAALSISKYSRLIRWMAVSTMERRAEPAPTLSEYKGARLAEYADRAIGVRENSFMWAIQKDLLKSWVERLAAQREAEAEAPEGAAPVPQIDADPGLKAALERLDRRMPVRFACLNAHGEVRALVRLLPAEEARDALEAAGMAGPEVLAVGAQLEPLEGLTARLVIMAECADAAFAARLEEALRRIATESADALPFQELTVEREGAVVTLRARLDRVPERVAAAAVALDERLAALREARAQ